MLHIRFTIFLLIVMLSGCANFNSIGRSTSLGVMGNQKNTAVHLDAQQRVVLSKENMKKVCAEPSPDAMAAYAASLTLGVSVPAQGAGSLAQSGQSSIAALGLRTQSITLMRDALYRVCEASLNDEIGQVHIATLLGRGLDLTSVVLAVEQLTGAVVASQPILTGTTSATASTTGSEMLHANQQVLGEAIIFRDTKKTELEAAQKKLTDKTGEVEAQQQKFNVVDAKYANEKETLPDNKVSAATEAEHKSESEKLEKLASEQEEFTREVESKEELHKQAVENVTAIENTRDASLIQMSTNVATKTSGSGQFNTVSSTDMAKLLESNVEKIGAVANAVKEMVLHALDKDYSVEACLSFLSSEVSINKSDTDTRKACFGLITAKVKNEHDLANKRLDIEAKKP